MGKKIRNKELGGSKRHKPIDKIKMNIVREKSERTLLLENLPVKRDNGKRNWGDNRDRMTREYFSGLLEVIKNEGDREIYLDSNHLFGPEHLFIGVFSRLVYDIPKLGKYQDVEGLKYYRREFNYLTKKLEKIIGIENVQISKGVKNEMFAYKRKVVYLMKENNMKSHLGDKVLIPIRKLCYNLNDKCKENKYRDEDPVNAEIFGLMRSISSNISKVDSEIMSLALSSGLMNGKNRLILTWDRGIKDFLRDFYVIINNNPEKLDLGEYSLSFLDYKFVNLSIGRMIYGERGFKVGDQIEYRNFFNGKIREESEKIGGTGENDR